MKNSFEKAFKATLGRAFKARNPRPQVAAAQSFAKNMGLYGQRIGCLSILCASKARPC